MKILPCKTCHAPALARRRPEILMTLGSITGNTVNYLCARCSRMQRLTAPEFNRLPTMTQDEIAARNCDLTPERERVGLNVPARPGVDPTSTPTGSGPAKPTT